MNEKINNSENRIGQRDGRGEDHRSGAKAPAGRQPLRQPAAQTTRPEALQVSRPLIFSGLAGGSFRLTSCRRYDPCRQARGGWPVGGEQAPRASWRRPPELRAATGGFGPPQGRLW